MKKILPVFVVVGVIVAIVAVRTLRQPVPTEPEAPTPPPVTYVLGDKTVFDMKFRSFTLAEAPQYLAAGKMVELVKQTDSPFIAAVKKQAENPITVFHNTLFARRSWMAIESNEAEVLAVYFDVNADGKLSAGDRLEPVDIPIKNQQRLIGLASFVTPEFTIVESQGRQIPFKCLFRAYLARNNAAGELQSQAPELTCAPYGLYEGTALLDGQDMVFRLYSGFFSAGFATLGSTRFTLEPTSGEQPGRPQKYLLSSLVFLNGKFCRIFIEDGPDQTLKLTYAEDVGPRGKYVVDVGNRENLQFRVLHTSVYDAKGNPMSLYRAGNELPVGEYKLGYGSVRYGLENEGEYTVGFRDTPVFAVQEGRTTAIKLDKPEIKAAVLKSKDRQAPPRTEFVEGTEVYFDVAIKDEKGINFSSFRKMKDPEEGGGTAVLRAFGSAALRARIQIVDADGNEVANQALEYG